MADPDANAESLPNSVPPADGSGSEYSKEYVQKMLEENAALRHRMAAQDKRDRDAILAAQPNVNKFIETIAQDFPDFKGQIEQIGSWAKEVHQAQRPDNEMPLVRFVECCSARDKRSREESEAVKENADALREACKTVDALKAADASKAARIAELEELCSNRQRDNEALVERLASADALGKFAFSERGSREQGATDSTTTATSVPAAGKSPLVTTTSNASGKARMGAPPAPTVDPLMAFLNTTGSGGSSMVMPSFGSTHELLGAPSSAGGVGAAIRSSIV